MIQQTAVDLLLDWMGKNQYFIGNDLLKAVEKIKQIEKEQIIIAHNDGKYVLPPNENGQQYYNDIYGGQGSPDTSPNTQNK